jgi:hypothetical protein
MGVILRKTNSIVGVELTFRHSTFQLNLKEKSHVAMQLNIIQHNELK